MATIRLHVFVDGTGKARVHPGLVFAGKSDTIEWTNHTKDDVFLAFPDGILDEPGGVKQHRKVVGAAGKHGPKIKEEPPKGSQPYNVFCLETGTLAEGNSRPEVIIE